MSAQRDSGFAALQRGDFNGAIALLEEACRIAPTDYDAYQYLAAAYQQAGRSNDASHAQIAAVNLQPSNPQARYNLGVVLERAGYSVEARQAYQQALQLKPDYSQAAQALARMSGGAPASGQPAPPPSPPYQPAPAQQPNWAQPTAEASTGGSQTPYASGTAPAYSAAGDQQSSTHVSAPIGSPYNPGHLSPPGAGQPPQPTTPYPQPSPGIYQPPTANLQPPGNYGYSQMAQSSAPMVGQPYPPRTIAPAYDVNPYAVQQARGGPAPAIGRGCTVCGAGGPIRSVNYSQNIGLLIMRFSKRIGGEMCEGCASKHFWEYTLTTLVLGWFGVISFFVTPFIIVGNVISFAKGAPAGQRLLAISLMVIMLVPIAVVIWLIATSKPSGPSD